MRLEGAGEADMSPSDHRPVPTRTEDGSYFVTWTFRIAIAVPRGSSGTGQTRQQAPEESSSRGPSSVCLKAESCYHVELKLPGQAETASVDLITFGLVAKILEDDKFKVTAPVQVWVWPLRRE